MCPQCKSKDIRLVGIKSETTRKIVLEYYCVTENRRYEIKRKKAVVQ